MASQRSPTGLPGFDEMNGGGLPRGRVTAVIGGPGSGKTLFGLQFLVKGARDLGEPGIFVAFEECSDDVVANVSSFDWDLAELRGNGIEFIDAQLSQSIVSGGAFDLLGLLAILGVVAKRTGAKRVVFDGVDVLLAHLGDSALVRSEVYRIREWLAETGLTGIITAKGEAADARLASDYEFLQFIADCVVRLPLRVVDGTAVRFLRVAKYRGCAHSPSEVPFNITTSGFELAGMGIVELDHPAYTDRVSSGVERLDTMLGGGYFRGSSVLISGAPGTAKTSLAISYVDAACERGEPALYVSFDEAPEQIIRNVASIGIDLTRHVKSKLLRIFSMRTMAADPEAHVSRIRALLAEHDTRHLVIDPLSALTRIGGESVAERAGISILDYAKRRGITVLSTSLLGNVNPTSEQTPMAVSTIADTWMHVSYVNQGGERNRALTIIKSRGTDHSNQVRELVLSSAGVNLADVYTVGGEVLMGTLRWQEENEAHRDQAAALHEAELREKTAELALAETIARAGTLAQEQLVREGELDRVRAERRAEAERLGRTQAGALSRRGADASSQETEVAK
ncbi:MAG: circadian clock protein KaiC [Pseudomonadota bacterium]|nr:circadian clock protein KaiC [Pseudomonadota bacterium]